MVDPAFFHDFQCLNSVHMVERFFFKSIGVAKSGMSHYVAFSAAIKMLYAPRSDSWRTRIGSFAVSSATGTPPFSSFLSDTRVYRASRISGVIPSCLGRSPLSRFAETSQRVLCRLCNENCPCNCSRRRLCNPTRAPCPTSTKATTKTL